MNSDDKFWVCVWSIVGAVIATIVISIATYYHHKNIVINEMVKNGISSIAALCALDDTIGNNPTCVILAVKEKE